MGKNKKRIEDVLVKIIRNLFDLEVTEMELASFVREKGKEVAGVKK